MNLWMPPYSSIIQKQLVFDWSVEIKGSGNKLRATQQYKEYVKKSTSPNHQIKSPVQTPD